MPSCTKQTYHRSCLGNRRWRPDPRVVASTSLSMDVAKRLSTPQCGQIRGQVKAALATMIPRQNDTKLIHALAKPRQNDAATVRNMLTQFYKLLQVNLVLTRTLVHSLSYCWSLVFRISSQGSSTHQDAVSV